jgi:hypothetical protein
MSSRGFARGHSAAYVRFVLLSSAAIIALSAERAAAASSDYGGFTWTTDRAEPQVWEVLPNFAGRDDVLHIQTYDKTPLDPQPGFYQTEGRYTLTNNPVGQSFISGDIYIAAGLQNSDGINYVNMGMWGVVGQPVPFGDDSYPVINFYNGGVLDPAFPPEPMVQQPGATPNVGEIRVYDSGRWIVTTGVNALSSAGSINYGGWNTFRINYVPGATAATGRMDMYLNDVLIQSLGCGTGSNTCADFAAINPATDSLYSIILNSRTNGASPYDVYWSNILASTREEYYDAAAIAPTAIAGGDMLLGTYVDRRGLDWDNQKATWMHAVAGNASFDDGNGRVSSSVAGAQFGLDLVALGDPSTRAGVTFGYSGGSSDVTLPSGVDGGSSDATSPSIGAYITHSDSAFYADVLGQYRFLNFDVNAPTSTGKVSGGSVDVAAEAGTHVALGEGFTLTPFVQLTYQHVMLDPTTLGGLDVSFGDSDALIGRARLLAEAKMAGLKMFASAGVAQDLLGAKQTTVDGTPFASAIGGARAEFTGGLEGIVGGGLSFFGSGEYDVSFDGNSKTYLGRAGFRGDF